MATKAWIKSFTIDQILKNNGIEIQVDDGGKQFGDLKVAKTGIIWCEGKTSKNVTKFTFEEFNWIAWYKKEAAIKAARKRDGM